MLNRIALCVALILSTTFTASAATRHHRVSHVPPQYYNAVPSNSAVPSNFCPTNGAPCRVDGDEW
jgi:hypothetical protein